MLLTRPSTTPLSLTKRSGLKVARARRVVFQQEVVDLGAAEEPLRHRFIAAGREIVPLEIAPAHVDAENHIGRRAGHRVVDAIDIEIDQTIGLLPRVFDHLADRRIAQLRKSDLVQLNVAAAGLGQVRDLVPEDAAEVGEESLRPSDRCFDPRSPCSGRNAWSKATAA